MDIELQKYYENRFDMFSHPAWKELMEDVQNMLNANNTLDGVTVDNLKFRQGEISMMRWLLSLKKTTEDAYEGLVNENT